jgi:hypothetical protein
MNNGPKHSELVPKLRKTRCEGRFYSGHAYFAFLGKDTINPLGVFGESIAK